MAEPATQSVRTLDATAKQETRYAIPLWLRDQQILHSTARVKGRIKPGDRTEEPCAVVGFGPSLNDTWEELRGYKHILSSSGSHRFLLDRGIVPTWHVEVDPRPHKVTLLGTPDERVTYLPSSTCAPAYFDHLQAGLGEAFDERVLLWHVYDPTEEGIRTLPPGEWAVTGGCDVGLRAMAMAGFLGFRNVHVYGLDGCTRNDKRHAGPHPLGGTNFAQTTYDGKVYWTTPAMLEAARQTLHELKQMPGVSVTFHGDGLTQTMVAKERDSGEPVAPVLQNVVGFVRAEVISAEYRDLNAQLHRDNLAYGVGGGKHAKTVLRLAEKLKTHSILDYGAGKGGLAKAIPFPIWEYDPAIPGKQESPRPADLVACTDVLEHIEPDYLGGVLADLSRCVKQIGYLVIHTQASKKTLADGRNAHLIQEGAEWWAERLGVFFQVGKVIQKGPLLHVLVGPKRGKAAKPKVSVIKGAA